MLSLSSWAIAEKNRTASDNPWLLLLRLDVDALEESYYLVRNTEYVSWDSMLWTAIPFEVDEISDSNKEIPEIHIRIGNVNQLLTATIEAAGGLVGSRATLFVVNAENLAAATAEIEMNFDITGCEVNEQWVTLKAGVENPFNRRFPRNRLLKHCCRFVYRGTECGYVGSVINNAAAVNKGSGRVGVPATGHGFTNGNIITIDGTTNYDGTYTVHSTTTTNEIVITVAYAAETFGGTELAYHATCNKQLSRCREIGNSERFGGFPGVGRTGLYA